jgi:hypothetical protein
MKRVKSTKSKASSYMEMGAYWDNNDLGEVWDQTEEADFEFIAEPQINYFAVEKELSEKLRLVAANKGVSADTLLNMWVQEKLMSNAKWSGGKPKGKTGIKIKGKPLSETVLEERR